MSEEQKQPNTPATPNTQAEFGTSSGVHNAQGARPPQRGPRRDGPTSAGGRPDFKKNPRRFAGRPEKQKPEYDQKIIDIRRVARVVAGGRRFSFSVALVIGDRKGKVGVGLGKAGDTALAIEKAMKSAKKKLVKIPMTKTMSIPYETTAKFSSSVVVLTPAPGRGIVAGSSVRSIIELAGLKDIGAKLRSGSKNRLNNARATIHALKSLTPHRKVIMAQQGRGAKVEAK
ncbi:MAG: 30S ribosomal protein S5 [Patescibacteria group bacterium]